MVKPADSTNLNEQQRDAATRLWASNKSALQVIAGAGSGKTSTLIAAVQEAERSGIAAARIVILTFSRRAAHELKERLAARDVAPGFCGTIHALAFKLLRERGERFSILKDSAKLRADWIRSRHAQYSHVPDRVLSRHEFLSGEDVALWSEYYSHYLAEAKALDFDTMIGRASAIAHTAPPFDAVFVDEFQDTSPDQVAFIKSLAAKKFFVVGDDWQSIYAFRGADVTLTQNFTQTFPKSERVFLLHNYRSSHDIVALGNRAIRLSSSYVPKKLKATRKRISKPYFFFAESENTADVWSRFLRVIPKIKPKVLAGPVTILVRTNAQRHMLEQNLPAGMQVLTIHKSKGLEFDNVIVFGITEHNMPHRDNGFDEEVRLLYVALTRAREYVGFVGWESGERRSAFIPFLMRHCRLVYL